MDISNLLAPSFLEIYEKNREWIEANKDFEFVPPKGEIKTSDDTPPENLFKENSKPVKLLETKII